MLIGVGIADRGFPSSSHVHLKCSTGNSRLNLYSRQMHDQGRDWHSVKSGMQQLVISDSEALNKLKYRYSGSV